ncbi:MAG: hypothetical protein ACFE8M_03805 [Candidatus Hermodarchaeota archaeon]
MLSGFLDYFAGRVFLIVAISFTILFGTLSGGLSALSKKQKKAKES